jgi:hypothetical protein
LGVPTALTRLFDGASAWMGEAQGPNYWSWMRRPRVDPTSNYNSGTHMLFMPGCAEFKVQRWIERNPWTGAPLGVGGARWWPEEDVDGNGIPNEANVNPMSPWDHSDFQAPYSWPSICEYFNGPVPPAPAAGWAAMAPFTAPHYPSAPAAGSWFCHGEQEMPKAIKVTVRLYDPNKRIADGQVFTMTFGTVGG